MSKRITKKIGLALGSGAARGMAQIGVLKVLEQESIPVNCIAGTSFGAVIGALYASGVTVEQMEQVAEGVHWRRLAALIDPTLPTSGLIDGRKVSLFLEELLPKRTFEELDIPLAVIATDIETGESLTIRRGDLLEALRAAISFPGIFTPVPFGDRFLVDGGISNPIPVDVVRELGAEVTVGVCTIPEVDKRTGETFLPARSAQKSHPKSAGWFTPRAFERRLKELWPRNSRTDKGGERRPPNIFRVFAQSIVIMENEIADLTLKQNHIDLLIRPRLNGITLLEFNRAKEAIEAGERATRRHLAHLRTIATGD